MQFQATVQHSRLFTNHILTAVLMLQVRHVFAGTAARTMAQALIHPLDTVKTRLQVQFPVRRWARWLQIVQGNSLRAHATTCSRSSLKIMGSENLVRAGADT